MKNLFTKITWWWGVIFIWRKALNVLMIDTGGNPYISWELMTLPLHIFLFFSSHHTWYSKLEQNPMRSTRNIKNQGEWQRSISISNKLKGVVKSWEAWAFLEQALDFDQNVMKVLFDKAIMIRLAAVNASPRNIALNGGSSRNSPMLINQNLTTVMIRLAAFDTNKFVGGF